LKKKEVGNKKRTQKIFFRTFKVDFIFFFLNLKHKQEIQIELLQGIYFGGGTSIAFSTESLIFFTP
jgi:hypothetical protein